MHEGEFYERLVRQVPDYAIFGIGLDGRATSWNEGVRNVLGYDESEFIGLDTALLFVPEDRDAGLPARALEEAAATGSASNDRWMLRKEGVRFWVGGEAMDAGGTTRSWNGRTSDRRSTAQVRRSGRGDARGGP